MKQYRIAAIPADGIGPEVIDAGLQALEALQKRDGGFALDVRRFDWGSDYYKANGRMMPEDGLAQLKGFDGEPIVAQLTMSWATRVRRDDLVTFHVDGTHGSAVATLTECRAQSRVATPRPVWNPEVKQPMDFFD